MDDSMGGLGSMLRNLAGEAATSLTDNVDDRVTAAQTSSHEPAELISASAMDLDEELVEKLTGAMPFKVNHSERTKATVHVAYGRWQPRRDQPSTDDEDYAA